MPAQKSAEAFRTIGEVSEWLGVKPHVLRFWEGKFPQVRPVQRAGGRRYYRQRDVALLGGLRVLLHDEGLSIREVQKILREQGIAVVCALSDGIDRPRPELRPVPPAPRPVVPGTGVLIARLAGLRPGRIDPAALRPIHRGLCLLRARMEDLP